MTKLLVALCLITSVAAAATRTSIYEGTTSVGIKPRSFGFRIELTWADGQIGSPNDDTTETVTSCPPGLHHTCTSKQVCKRHAKFGIDDLHITVSDVKQRAVGEARTTYVIETTTTAEAPVGAVCAVEWPTIAKPGTGSSFDMYVKISETERFHLMLAPTAVFGPKSAPVPYYLLADVVLPPWGQPPGQPSIEFSFEHRPDLVHAWVAEGTSGTVLLTRK